MYKEEKLFIIPNCTLSKNLFWGRARVAEKKRKEKKIAALKASDKKVERMFINIILNIMMNIEQGLGTQNENMSFVSPRVLFCGQFPHIYRAGRERSIIKSVPV